MECNNGVQQSKIQKGCSEVSPFMYCTLYHLILCCLHQKMYLQYVLTFFTLERNMTLIADEVSNWSRGNSVYLAIFESGIFCLGCVSA